MKIKLSIPEMLPIIRKAFDNRELQMFDREIVSCACLYTGPCAIGVCLSPEEQQFLDTTEEDRSDTYIEGYINRSTVEVKEDEIEDIIKLQNAHDMVLCHSGENNKNSFIRQFGELLVELEGKYL